MHIFSKDLFFSIFSTKPDCLQAKVTIVPDPSDSTVTLTATGYSQSGNSIDVPIGTVVKWKVEKTAYDSREGEFLVVGNTSISVKLSEQPKRTVSINTIPADASVLITGDGYVNAQGTKAISVPVGTHLTYSVSDPLEQLSLVSEGDVTVQEDTSINVTMKTKAHVTKVLPPDAVVKINGELGSYRELPCNQVVDVSVTRDGYDSFNQTFEKNNRGIVPDFISEIELKETTYILTVESTPTNASLSVVVGTKTYTGTGRVVVDSVLPGTTIKATATLSGYDAVTQTFTMPASDLGKTLSLSETLYIVTITATPSDATVVIKVDGSQVASGIGKATTSAKKGATITYEVSYEGVSESGTHTMTTANFSKNMTLDAQWEEVFLANSPQTKKVSAGKYKYVCIGAGGPGGLGNSVMFQHKSSFGGGGGGAGYVSVGTFVTSGETLTLVPGEPAPLGTSDSDVVYTKIIGGSGAVLAFAHNGKPGNEGSKTSKSGNGGAGSSGGGGAGKNATSSSNTYCAGAPGGIGGFNGNTSSLSTSGYGAGGAGVKGANGKTGTNGGAAEYNNGNGKGGVGLISIQDTLLNPVSFASVTQETLYDYIGGGGGGGGHPAGPSGTSVSRVGGGGGGGGWTSGSDADLSTTAGGAGGAGAILLCRIAWS